MVSYLPAVPFKLVRLVDRLLDILEKDPLSRHLPWTARQSSWKITQIRPEERRRLEELVRAGRLLIGPWYVLPDEFLVSGESLLRDLARGISICARFGGAMMVGYVPGPVGHIAQLPQLLQGCGIDTTVLWRGVGRLPNGRFRWVAPDGTGVTCIYLASSYGNAANLPLSAPELSAAGADGGGAA